MANPSKGNTYTKINKAPNRAVGLVKLGIVATASATLGGLATAWYYRETLKKLQNPVKAEDLQNSEFKEQSPNSDVYDAGSTVYESRAELETSEPGTLPSQY